MFSPVSLLTLIVLCLFICLSVCADEVSTTVLVEDVHHDSNTMDSLVFEDGPYSDEDEALFAKYKDSIEATLLGEASIVGADVHLQLESFLSTHVDERSTLPDEIEAIHQSNRHNEMLMSIHTEEDNFGSADDRSRVYPKDVDVSDESSEAEIDMGNEKEETPTLSSYQGAYREKPQEAIQNSLEAISESDGALTEVVDTHLSHAEDEQSRNETEPISLEALTPMEMAARDLSNRILQISRDELILFLSHAIDRYEHSNALVNTSAAPDLVILSQNDVIQRDSEIQLCQEREQQVTSALHRAEQQRDLAEIRIKKCKNDVTVMKITAEQQILATEEEKVSLQYQLKEAQRELLRLRVQLEETRRSSPAVPAPCACNPHVTSSKSPLSDPSHPPPPVKSREDSLEGLDAYINQSNNSSIKTRARVTTNFDTGKLFDSMLITLQTKGLPSCVGFVAWEYQQLFSVTTVLQTLLGKYLWKQSPPPTMTVSERLKTFFVEHIEPRAAQAITHIDDFLTRNDVEEIYMHFVRPNGMRLGDLLRQLGGYLTELPEQGSTSNIILVVMQDMQLQLQNLVSLLAKQKQVRYVFGSDSEVAVRYALMAVTLWLSYVYFRFLLGIGLLAMLLALLPVLLTLLVATILLSLVMPRRKTKKAAKRTKKTNNHDGQNIRFSNDNGDRGANQGSNSSDMKASTSGGYAPRYSGEDITEPRTFIGFQP